MTRDQKRALTGLATLIFFKAVIYISIQQSAKHARKKIAEYEANAQ